MRRAYRTWEDYKYSSKKKPGKDFISIVALAKNKDVLYRYDYEVDLWLVNKGNYMSDCDVLKTKYFHQKELYLKVAIDRLKDQIDDRVYYIAEKCCSRFKIVCKRNEFLHNLGTLSFLRVK